MVRIKKGSILECLICGNEFYRRPSRVKRMGGKFCSNKCVGIYNSRREFSKEHIENLSKAFSGDKNPMFGMSGQRNPNWKGGVSNDIVYLRKRRMKYYYNNPFKHKIYRQRAKALRRYGGDLSIQTIQNIYESNIQSFGTLTCYLCLKPIEFGQDSLDHKIPLCRGGNNQEENLAIAHIICNSKKRDKTPEEYKNALDQTVSCSSM